MTSANRFAVWEDLVRYHRLVMTEMDDRLMATFGTSLEAYDVLHQVAEHDGPITMGDLASRLLIANSSCHRLVSRLVDGGELERIADPTDGRVVRVQLTTTGRRLYRRMAAAHGRDIDELFLAPLSGQQQSALADAFEALLEARQARSREHASRAERPVAEGDKSGRNR